MAPTLENVVEQINRTLPSSQRWSISHFCRIVNARDACNKHLAFPANLRHYERAEPLSADLTIQGEIFTLVWNGHWPRLDLKVHDNIRALADHAETWLNQSDGYWAFRGGILTPRKIIAANSLDGYDVFQAVAGTRIAVKRP